MAKRFLRLPSRESIIVLAGYGTAGVTLLLTLKAMTLLLPTEQYGLFALGLSAQIIFVQLIFGPLGASVLRLAPDALERSDLRACVAAATGWTKKAAVVCILATLLGALVLAWLNPEQIGFQLAASISAICYGVTQVNESVLSGTRHRERAAISSSLGQFLRSGGAILAGFQFHSAHAAMTGYLGGSIVALLLAHRLTHSLVRKLDTHPAPAEPAAVARDSRFIWEYGQPFLIWAAPTALYMASDRWILQVLSGPADVAVYSAAQQLTQLPVNFLFQLLQLIWAPILFGEQALAERTGATRSGMLQKLGLVLLAGSVAGTLILFWTGEWLILLFATPAYLRSAPFLPLIFFGSCLFQLGQWYALDQLRQKRSDLLIWPKLATAVLGIASYALGTYWAGLKGLALASVASSAFYVISVLWTRRALAR